MLYIYPTVVPYVLFSQLIKFVLYFVPQQVWPSFWTLGLEETWPAAGEIDIIEGINDMVNNQVALHTTVGCYQANVTTQSGTTSEIDCSTPQGCLVEENKSNSYGESFALAGGGVFALLLDQAGISVYFFSVCKHFCFYVLISHYLSDPTSPQTSNKQLHPLKLTRPPGVSQQHRIRTLHVPFKHSSLLNS